MVERTLISFPSQLQLIGRLQNLLYLSSSMVFISGEKGSGKSTLTEQLSNQLPDKTQQAFIRLVEPVSIAQIRQKIIAQLFEQPLFNADDSLFNALLLLKEKQDVDVARVIVIDNAHFIPEQLIDEIARVIKQKALLTDNEISFVLLSDEASNSNMVNQVKRSGENKEITALTFKLSPLDINESQKLLIHSLTQIGYSPKVDHQDALAKQLLHCQGIPEKILLLATQVSSGHLDKVKSSWFKTRFPAILLMLVLLLIAGGLGFYLYPKFITPQLEDEARVEQDSMLLHEIPSTDLITSSQDRSASIETLAGQWSNGNQEIKDNQLSVGEADNKDRTIIAGAQLIELESSVSQAVSTTPSDVINAQDFPDASENQLVSAPNSGLVNESTLLENTDVSDGNKPIKTLLDDEVRSIIAKHNAVEVEKVVIEKPTIEKPIIATPATITPVVTPDIQRNAELAIVKPVVTDVETASSVAKILTDEATAVVNIAEAPQATSRDENGHKPFTAAETLLAINPDFYTLQLAVMSAESSLQVFITEHQLDEDDLFLYETTRSGKKWYVIISGQFASRQTATVEIQRLANLPTKLDSWAKKYSSVHQDLQLNE